MSDAPRERVHAGESLVVLTRDSALVESLRNLGAHHKFATAKAETELASVLMSGQAGVAIIDAADISTPIGTFTERLKSQFPDLVLIVAGNHDDQGALTSQVTKGTVYRFLHKPVSPQRVRLFVEAALRRHGEEISGAADPLAATGVLPEESSGMPRGALIGGAVVLAALLILGGWFVIRKPTAADVAGKGKVVSAQAAQTRDAVLEDLLARADTAVAKGALLAPPGTNAVELYRQAIHRNGDDPRGAAGVEKVIGKLLSAAEQQLATQQLDEAQKLIDQARAIKPDHVRVAFLNTQVGKARERALLAQAREAASSGNIAGAIAVLDGKAPSDTPSDATAPAHDDQKKLETPVAGLLAKAADRMRSGQLVEPAQDNARFFIESARTVSPNDPSIQQVEKQLDDAIVSEARKAQAAADIDNTQRWIDAALDSGVSHDQIAELTRGLQQLRADAKAKADAEGQANAATVAKADAADPKPPGTDATATDTGDHASGAVMTANASDPQPLRTAGSANPIASGTAAGPSAPSAVANTEPPAPTASPAPNTADDIISAGTLKLDRYTAPNFPLAARERGLSGWVDLQFLVATDGSVSDARIMGAEPVGVFEQAAMEALRKWRYKPVLRDGNAVAQRARLRMKFALDNK